MVVSERGPGTLRHTQKCTHRNAHADTDTQTKTKTHARARAKQHTQTLLCHVQHGKGGFDICRGLKWQRITLVRCCTREEEEEKTPGGGGQHRAQHHVRQRSMRLGTLWGLVMLPKLTVYNCCAERKESWLVLGICVTVPIPLVWPLLFLSTKSMRQRGVEGERERRGGGETDTHTHTQTHTHANKHTHRHIHTYTHRGNQ